MKKRVLSLFLALTMVVSLATVSAEAAGTIPATSNNINDQHYFTWSEPVKSYLFENQTGGLTRVEYIDGQIVAEDYSADFQIQASRIIPMELSLWGGFFSGERYNFFVFGQNNPNESDNVEVIRVVKYSKDWKRLGQASLRGANTTIPFEGGSLRMDEYDGKLYIRTSHEMYASSDGLNHQSSLSLCVDQEQMGTVIDTGTGYVSHSFNQFVLVDSEGYLVTVDHGDAYPRSAVMVKHNLSVENWPSSGWISNTTIQSFPGRTGNNITGASLGGLAETDSGYVVAYNYVDFSSSTDKGRNVYIGYVPKGNTQVTAAVRSVSPDESTSTPQLVSTGPDGGYVLWNTFNGGILNDTLYYVRYDSAGNVEGIQTATASLSDCAPIYSNGKAIWYTTNKSAPVFYTLDSSGVTAHPAGGSTVQQPTQPEQPQETTQPEHPSQSAPSFSDVPTTHWAYSYVERAADEGWVNGIGNGQFGADNQVTYAELFTMLVRVYLPQEADGYQEYPSLIRHWYDPYYLVATDYSFTEGLRFGFDDLRNEGDKRVVTRYDMAQFFYNVMDRFVETAEIYRNGYGTSTEWDNFYFPKYDAASVQAGIADWNSVPDNYREAVTAIVGSGIITGMDGKGTFNGNGVLTRAQAATVMCRFIDVLTANGGPSDSNRTAHIP